MKQRKDGRFLKTVTINNKRVFFYSSEPTEKKAEKDIQRQMLEYEQKEHERHTLFSSIADEWNTEYRLSIPDTTYKKSSKAQYNRILDYFADSDITQITAYDVDVFLHSLNYGFKTVAGHKCMLNMIFNYAVLHGYLKSNPVSVVKLPKNLKREKRKLPADEELREVSKHYEGFDLLPYFMLYTGCRKSEALAIRQEDIDFKNNVIKIRNHVIHAGNKPIFESVLKSDAAYRDIILLERLKEVLPKQFKGFLFSTAEDGSKPLSKGEYDNRWNKYCDKYNLNITAHQLRHGYATMLFEAEMDIKDTQTLMGHSDINLTRSIYTHIRETRMKANADKLNNFNF